MTEFKPPKDQDPDSHPSGWYTLRHFHMIKFLFVFSLIYVLFHFCYFQVTDSYLINVVYPNGIVSVASNVINFFSPAEATIGVANRLESAKASLVIVRGCDGAGVMFLLMAAIIAFPTPWQKRGQGLMMGLVLVFVLNTARVTGLYYIVAYRPDWFQILHTYLAPTFLIVVCGAFFLTWTCWSPNAGSARGKTQTV